VATVCYNAKCGALGASTTVVLQNLRARCRATGQVVASGYLHSGLRAVKLAGQDCRVEMQRVRVVKPQTVRHWPYPSDKDPAMKQTGAHGQWAHGASAATPAGMACNQGLCGAPAALMRIVLTTSLQNSKNAI